MKRLPAIIMALCLLGGASQNSAAHGGGLNSEGCHRETATGGYHCHRGSSSGSSDLKTVGLVLGGLVVVAIIYKWWNKRDSHMLNEIIGSSADEDGASVRLDLDESGNHSAGVYWKLRF